MTPSLPHQYMKVAEEQRAVGDMEAAAGYYLSASHGWYMRSRYLPKDLPQSDEYVGVWPKQIGRYVRDLLAALLCFRLADKQERARIHGEAGVLTVRDLLEKEPSIQNKLPDPRKGLFHEMLGDLFLFSGLGSPDESYATAKPLYEAADSQMGWQAEPEFDSLVRLLVNLADSVGYDIEENTRRRILALSLVDRIEYKMEHYETIINHVLEAGEWNSDS